MSQGESQNQRPGMQVGASVQYMRSRYASVLVRYSLFLPPPLPLPSRSVVRQWHSRREGHLARRPPPKLPLDVQMSCLVILLGLFLLADTMCSRDIRKWCVCVHALIMCKLVRVHVCACVCGRWKPDT